MIPYGRQDISQGDIDAVVSVLQSDFLTQGPMVPRFEQAVAERVGAKYAVACNSATSALHIACLALGLGHGDILWTSPITFVASANCARYCGASVDFVDIDPYTYNLCPRALARKLQYAAETNRLPKIVVPVHFGGQSCDMGAIHALALRYGFKIIEDASHAIGGQYRDVSIGSCLYSQVTIFSFHPVKIITTAEGGMALTNDSEIATRIALLRSHGITRDPSMMTHEPDGPWYYQQIALGYNYRMTELQAALGISQLDSLEDFLARRHELARRYDRLLNNAPVSLPWRDPEAYSAFHLYVVRLKLRDISSSHLGVFEGMRRRGIGVNLHYIPVHMQPYYQQMGFKLGDFPESESYYSEAISLPMYSKLSESEQDQVIDALYQELV